MSLPRTTREWYYGKKSGSYRDDLSLQASPLPTSLKSSDVLIKVHAVSLQYRDLVVSRFPDWYRGDVPDNLVPTSDMAGEVIAIGEEVKSWKPGDRVSSSFTPDHLSGPAWPTAISDAPGGGCNGMLAEYRVFREHSLVKIPDHLSFEEASTLPCAAVTAYNALMGPVPVKAGDTVLVQGTGGVSIFALQFAVASGATVILTSSSDKKLEIGRKLGAKYTINYKTTPDWEKEVLRITNGTGVDYTIEMGGPGTMMKSIEATKYAGWISMVGILSMSSEPSQNGSIVAAAIMREITLRGLLAGPLDLFKSMLRLMSANTEVTRPLIDRVFSFEESIKAFEYLESQAHVGKVVIKVA